MTCAALDCSIAAFAIVTNTAITSNTTEFFIVPVNLGLFAPMRMKCWEVWLVQVHVSTPLNIISWALQDESCQVCAGRLASVPVSVLDRGCGVPAKVLRWSSFVWRL